MELLEVFIDGGGALSPLHRRCDDTGGYGLSLSGDDSEIVRKCGIAGQHAWNRKVRDNRMKRIDKVNREPNL
jgi:hypothetical protein